VRQSAVAGQGEGARVHGLGAVEVAAVLEGHAEHLQGVLVGWVLCVDLERQHEQQQAVLVSVHLAEPVSRDNQGLHQLL